MRQLTLRAAAAAFVAAASGGAAPAPTDGFYPPPDFPRPFFPPWAEPAIPQSICQRREVLDVVGRRIIDQNHYARMQRVAVLEQPTREPNIVHCAIRLDVFFYDTPRLGPEAWVRHVVHAYEIKAVEHGFVVLDVR